MARIPIYNRQVGAGTAVGLPQVSAQAFGAGVGAVLADAGSEVSQLAQQQADKARQRKQVDERSEAATRLAMLTERAGKIVLDRRGKVASGGVGHMDGVFADFDAEAAQLSDGITDPDTLAWIRTNLAQERARLSNSEGVFEATKRADKLVMDYEAGDNAERAAIYARPDRQGLLYAITRRETVANGLDLPQDARDQLALKARYDLTTSYMQGLTERDPFAARRMIEGGELTGMVDADRLQALKNRADVETRAIMAAREQAQREAEADQRRQAAEAKRAAADAARDVADRLRDARDYLANGGTIDAAEMGQLTSAAMRVGKPELARGIQQLGLRSIVNTQLRGAPPVTIQATINELSAEINRAGGKANPSLLIQRDAAEAKLRATREALKSDPLSHAVREGVVPQLTELDPTKPETYAARTREARAVQARYGGRLNVFTADEAAVVATRFKGGVQDALSAAQELGRFGPRNVALAAAQIAATDPTAAHLATLGARDRGRGRQFLETVKAGEAVLKEKPKLFDAEIAADELDATLGTIMRELPGVGSVIKEVAGQYYAGTATRRGEQKFNSELYRQSINAALGRWRDLDGTMRGGIGEDLSGKPTILPSDLSEAQFHKNLNGITDASLAKFGDRAPMTVRGKPYDAASIRQGQMVPVGNGRYRVMLNGGYVRATGGGLFELQIGGRE